MSIDAIASFHFGYPLREPDPQPGWMLEGLDFQEQWDALHMPQRVKDLALTREELVEWDTVPCGSPEYTALQKRANASWDARESWRLDNPAPARVERVAREDSGRYFVVLRHQGVWLEYATADVSMRIDLKNPTLQVNPQEAKPVLDGFLRTLGLEPPSMLPAWHLSSWLG